MLGRNGGAAVLKRSICHGLLGRFSTHGCWIAFPTMSRSLQLMCWPEALEGLVVASRLNHESWRSRGGVSGHVPKPCNHVCPLVITGCCSLRIATGLYPWLNCHCECESFRLLGSFNWPGPQAIRPGPGRANLLDWDDDPEVRSPIASGMAAHPVAVFSWLLFSECADPEEVDCVLCSFRVLRG